MKLPLKNVRLSFPALFQAKSAQQGGEPKFYAAFLIPQEDPQIKSIANAIVAVTAEKWGDKPPKGIKTCLRNGDEKDFDGYEGHMYVSASSQKRPLVIDRDRTPLGAEDGRPYAGCYVNAIIRLWAQDNQYGRRINAELSGVQFLKDGDPFGGSTPARAEDFEEITEPEGTEEPF